eukprot:2134230-Amphidinium_carterae.1
MPPSQLLWLSGPCGFDDLQKPRNTATKAVTYLEPVTAQSCLVTEWHNLQKQMQLKVAVSGFTS